MSKKILVVDDDQELLGELKDTLSLNNYEVAAVGDPALALDLAVKFNPDCIVLDLKMPVKSGFQLASEIRHLYGFENIPIIAMSAFFKDEYESLMKLCDIKKCLKKPFTPQAIIAEIEAVFR